MSSLIESEKVEKVQARYYLPRSIVIEIKVLCARRRVSANKLVQELLEGALKAATEDELASARMPAIRPADRQPKSGDDRRRSARER